jgi:DNA-binding YbaB/EbfC family protein
VTEGFDPQALLARALEMQQRLLDAQAQAADETVEGSAGGGKVRVTLTGTGDVTAVRIDPSVVDPAEVELLEDLIVAALHDAAARVALLAEQRLGAGLGGGLGDLFGGGVGALDAGGDDDAGEDDDAGDDHAGDEEQG